MRSIDLMLLAASVAIALVGPGAFAVDSLLLRAQGRQQLTERAPAM